MSRLWNQYSLDPIVFIEKNARTIHNYKWLEFNIISVSCVITCMKYDQMSLWVGICPYGLQQWLMCEIQNMDSMIVWMTEQRKELLFCITVWITTRSPFFSVFPAGFLFFLHEVMLCHFSIILITISRY